MNEVKSPHPSLEELSEFVSGRLNDAESAAIELHVADCASCGNVLESLPEDTLVLLLRESSTATDRRQVGGGSGSSLSEESATFTGATVGVSPAASAASGVADAQTMQPHDDRPKLANYDIPPELADHPRYRVLGLLGAGGMGAVYRAEHRLMERSVALKVIARRLLERPAAV